MKISPVLEYYNKIMYAENEGTLDALTIEVQEAVIHKILTDDKDIMILNMAIKLRSNHFLIEELIMHGGGTTVMIVGNSDDFDPEEMQLEEFKEDEFEEFKDGNVVSMKDFTKKK